MMHDILVEYDLQEAFARSPSLLCRLMSIARSAMLVRRDFATFAVFIERCYRLMERRHGFAPAQRSYQLRLLYMLAHALYRSRHFAQSVGYLEQGRAILAAAPSRQFSEFGPRFTMLLAANYSFLNRNADSIGLLEKTLQATPALPLLDDLTARLQLSFHYFAEGKFQKANHTLISLGRTDHWLEQHLGLEWLLNRNLGEMLIQLELGNPDIALGRLQAIERSLREQFPATPDPDLPDAPTVPGGPYRYVLSYLSLVRKIIDNPSAARTPAFAVLVDELPTFLPLEREDLQARSFYAWLRARMLGRPYYEVLLEVGEL
jgi:tetratricopeptide (TPR) repeat protein